MDGCFFFVQSHLSLSLLLYSFPPFFDDHPFGIYEKILAGKIGYPPHFDANAKDLIKRLLTNDRTKRLGNLKVVMPGAT